MPVVADASNLWAAPAWVIVCAVILVIVLVAIALVTGREVTLWPPKIGPKQQEGTAELATTDSIQEGVSSAGIPILQQPAPPAADSDAFDEVYDAHESRKFYDAIASEYDRRNSNDLLRTHQAVVLQIKKSRSINPDLRVLDLGGGTGKVIATHFFDDRRLRWTLVDNSVAMLEQARENLAESSLADKLTIIPDDLRNVHTKFTAGKFDVVLMSLVLSSMSDWPDLSQIAALVRPGGRIIIADINPLYTMEHPHYAVMVNGRRMALRTRPINTIYLIDAAMGAGLTQGSLQEISGADTKYSFVAVFTKPVAVD